MIFDDDTGYVSIREKEIIDKLATMKAIIEKKEVYPSQLENQILESDKYCGDILFLKYLLYYSRKYPFIESMIENEEILININNIFYNQRLTFYLDDDLNATKNKVIHFVLCHLKWNFVDKCFRDKKIKINENGTDNRVVFYKINNIFDFAEKTIKTFEEKIKINLAKEFKKELSEFKYSIITNFSKRKFYDYNEFEMWSKKEQDDFEKAINIRLTAFCSNIGLPEKINIDLNYRGSRGKKPKGVCGYLIETFSKKPWFATLAFPLMLVDVVSVACDSIEYSVINRKINKHLLENVLSGENNLLLEGAKNTALLVAPISKKTDNPILLQDLEDIESTKKALSELFSSQDKFDIYVSTNCTMYLDPYLDYLANHSVLTKEEVNNFHNLFCKLNLILEDKINELKNKNDEISKIELNVIKDQVDKLLKEKNIKFLAEKKEPILVQKEII